MSNQHKAVVARTCCSPGAHTNCLLQGVSCGYNSGSSNGVSAEEGGPAAAGILGLSDGQSDEVVDETCTKGKC